MGIELAEWQEILGVLRETFKIWSPGLGHAEYYHYIWRQMSQPWSRANYRYILYKDGGQVVSSCKLYTVELASRAATHRFGGIGAVYTQEAHRGRGHASRMLTEVIDLAKSEGAAGMILYSDIGSQMYERHGFRTMGSRQFTISIPDLDTASGARDESVAALAETSVDVAPLMIDDIPWLVRHHRRWLRRQPFGFARSPDYWAYKIGREIYLHYNSGWSWPRLELIRIEPSPDETSYAIIEHGGATLRVLEAVGPASRQKEIWFNIFALALQRRAKRVRGWEGVCPEFIRKPIFTAREWGAPMILPLYGELEQWCGVVPCPLLELDHL